MSCLGLRLPFELKFCETRKDYFIECLLFGGSLLWYFVLVTNVASFHVQDRHARRLSTAAIFGSLTRAVEFMRMWTMSHSPWSRIPSSCQVRGNHRFDPLVTSQARVMEVAISDRRLGPRWSCRWDVCISNLIIDADDSGQSG
jgi:hypothetical protein